MPFDSAFAELHNNAETTRILVYMIDSTTSDIV